MNKENKNLTTEEIVRLIVNDSRIKDLVVSVIEEYLNGRQRMATGKREKNWAEVSDSALRQAYFYRIRKGMAIEEALLQELTRRFQTFDADTQKFTGRKPKKVEIPAGRKHKNSKPLSELKDISLRQLFYKEKKSGTISDELNAEMARRFPTYDPEKREFSGHGKHAARKSAAPVQNKVAVKKDKAYLINAYHNALRKGSISEELHVALMEAFPDEYDADRQHLRITPEMRAAAEPVLTGNSALNTQVLRVNVKMTKITPDGPYSDVYVNGVRILHNHVDTRVETFLNGTVLGVYGVPTDIPNTTTRPSWQLYDARLVRKTFNRQDSITKQDIYIERVLPLGTDKLVLDMSTKNKTRIIMDARPIGKIFEIMKEKTK